MVRITKVLIANRGEIAARVARACRELGLASVAVASEADRGALHVREADEAVFIGPAPPAQSYLDVQALLAAAARAGADAVHPGYGFLSENAAFARAVIDAGLTWVGPPPEAIAAMGDKVEARRLMQAAGVPVVPGAHDPAEAPSLGLPLLVKAAAGGGGRGMRVVQRLDALPEAVAAASREALAAFGDGRVFVERYVARGRHIEVQVFADGHGRVIHLGERECSVQRRHQKVIEEAPSPVVDEALRQRLGEAAVTAARAVGYVGAGTVEFLYDEATGEFFFLEMNTRLQVEHPVTEAVWGVDLVQAQLEVAMGMPLPEVRSAPRGWAIEARLCAEDVPGGYLPQSGPVLDLHLPALPGLRLDSGVATGDAVSIHYDSMIAKVIASGRDREHARRRLALALRQMSVLGVKTNREALVQILEHPEFVSGDISTRWLEGLRFSAEVDEQAMFVARVAALARELSRPRALLPGVAKGWRNNRDVDAELSVSGEVMRWRAAGPAWIVSGMGREVCVRFEVLDAVAMRLEIDGWSVQVRVVEEARGWQVFVSPHTIELVRDLRFPEPGAAEVTGGCVAPMPGRVLRVEVGEGQAVSAGEVLVVIEAMKMEQALRAPADGVVRAVHVAVGDLVEAGQALLALED